ncbi:hypothetical protein BCV72DRAFT_119070 [Rhizopus microsporus var. microsporus]|uniref:Uncharacterized protein n=1 Tax=Rhizopus microsporus var. microsporus TaxID=86635 RepID=A0A1X0R3X9_RHIZD|nr:hypothetical protein BCV72DRAFT_119070 [Rhizopus microsporus var. microsporus]
MGTITREHTICVFYHQPYNKSQAIELLKAIENVDVEDCYKDAHYKPFLLYTNSIYTDSYNIRTYRKADEPSDTNNEIQDKKTTSILFTEKIRTLHLIDTPLWLLFSKVKPFILNLYVKRLK